MGWGDALVTHFPARNGLPQNHPASCRLTTHLQEGAAPTAHVCSPTGTCSGWQRHSAERTDRPGTCKGADGRQRTPFPASTREPWAATSPLLGIRLKFRAMAEMFLSFPNTLFIMQKSALQPSITGRDSCLAGQGSPAVCEGCVSCLAAGTGPLAYPGGGARGRAGTAGIVPSPARVDGTA